MDRCVGRGEVSLKARLIAQLQRSGRNQAAPWREVFYLVQQDIASVGDVDTIVATVRACGGRSKVRVSACISPVGGWHRSCAGTSRALNGDLVLDSVDLGDIVAQSGESLWGLLRLKA